MPSGGFFILKTLLYRTTLFFLFVLSASPTHKWEFPPEVTVFFSPGGHLAKELTKEIDQEMEEVAIAAYCLSHKTIFGALERALSRKVRVTALIDPFSLIKQELLMNLAKAGARIFVWDPKQKNGDRKKGAPQGLMHHKFCVLGKSKVWTGSFNFTHPADQRHQENALLLVDSKTAPLYRAQLDKMIDLGGVPLLEYKAK